MDQKISILGIAGSLRKGSFNKFALQATKQLAPANVNFEIYERLGELPLFNQDNEMNPPPIVVELKQKIRAADAIVIATPEYNYSVPGVLKNLIDWASRPYGDSAWEGKPVAIMGAGLGGVATARAQYHLRQMFVFLNGHLINKPEVMIPTAGDKFDANGNLTDEKTKNKIKEMLAALAAWALQLKN